MRTSIFLAISATIFLAPVANSAESAPPQPQASEKAIRLPYGVEDVVKLSRAKISEDVIVKYVQNSGTIYNLSPEVLVYMRNEGVSDRILNTMLDQGKTVTAAGTTSDWSSQGQSAQPQPQAQPQPAPQVAPVYTQPPQPEPKPAPVSTVYVVPYYQATYAEPYWPGWYGPYYSGWYSPAISLGFGFGFGHGHGHGHYGGYVGFH